MFHKSITLGTAALFTALIGLGTAQAMPIAAASDPLPAVQTASPASANIELAAWGHRYWHGGHGWHGGWHDHGYWGPGLALGLGLGLATAPYYGYGPGYAYAGGSHVQWCLDHFRTYDPRSNTYIGADGYRHACIGRY